MKLTVKAGKHFLTVSQAEWDAMDLPPPRPLSKSIPKNKDPENEDQVTEPDEVPAIHSGMPAKQLADFAKQNLPPGFTLTNDGHSIVRAPNGQQVCMAKDPQNAIALASQRLDRWRQQVKIACSKSVADKYGRDLYPEYPANLFDWNAFDPRQEKQKNIEVGDDWGYEDLLKSLRPREKPHLA